MKLKNFKPRPMREVKYFDVKISIPADHKWVATNPNGSVHSFSYEPHYRWYAWITSEPEPFVIYVAGRCMEISKHDAANSLRHYPKGAK